MRMQMTAFNFVRLTETLFILKDFITYKNQMKHKFSIGTEKERGEAVLSIYR